LNSLAVLIESASDILERAQKKMTLLLSQQIYAQKAPFPTTSSNLGQPLNPSNASSNTLNSIHFEGLKKQPAPRVHLENESFEKTSLSGKLLSMRQWWPLGQTKPEIKPGQSPILLVPGYGGRTGWGAPLADGLLKGHPHVYGLNLPQLDGDPAVRQPFEGSASLIQEVKDAIATLAKEHEAPVTVIATSIGGVLATLATAENPENTKQLVLIAPAFKPSLKFINPLTMASSLWTGTLKLLGFKKKGSFKLKGAEEDIGKAKGDDGQKKNHGMAITPGMLWSFLKVAYSGRAKQAAKNLNTPTLMMVAGQDKMTNPKASKAIFEALPAPNKQFLTLPTARHNLVRDEDIVDVTRQIHAWLLKN
jgi:alpha-beta hydrolase superfamily lysophospholipase